jgi:glycosyltransferase involved in cell wall biosynthesis
MTATVRDAVLTSGQALSTPSLLWLNHFAVAPRDGGGTRHFELGRELTRRGWNVSIAAADFHLHSRQYTRRPSADHRAPIVEHLDQVRFHWIWSAPYSANDWRRAWNWASFAYAAWRQPSWSADPVGPGHRPDRQHPDVVIGSSPHLFAALAGERIARRLGVPFVFEVRDLWPESMLAVGGRKGAVYLTFDAIANYLYRRAQRVIVLSRGNREYLVRRGLDERKVLYVPNGVDLDAFASCGMPAASRERGDFTLVYAGAHGPANGLEAVLNAAERLRDRRCIMEGREGRVRFLLVGDGPSKAALQAHAASRALDNVSFLDPVPKREMPALLARADAGLMVLRRAPLFEFGVSPNKLFDYFGAALPVVCNVPGEVATMVEQAGAGEQAVDDSGAALADAVLRLASRTPEERRAMGASARAWVAREHSRTVLAERLDHALRGVIGA